MIAVDRVSPAADILGECPLWDDQKQLLYWVDIERKLLQSFSPHTGDLRSWTLPERVGSLCLSRDGEIVAGMESAVFVVTDSPMRKVAAPEDQPEMRFNDGRCDPYGRFVTGTMDIQARNRRGSLYVLGQDGVAHKFTTGMGVPNGIAWSPDGGTFYYADSMDRMIYACDYDPSAWELKNRRVFADLTAVAGVPDGAAIDADGFLWSAQCNGWSLRRYAPDGRLDRVLELPVQYPTSCCFGGPDYRTLYVTTALWDLTPEQRAAQPLSGSVLSMDAGVAGIPEYRFGPPLK